MDSTDSLIASSLNRFGFTWSLGTPLGLSDIPQYKKDLLIKSESILE